MPALFCYLEDGIFEADVSDDPDIQTKQAALDRLQRDLKTQHHDVIAYYTKTQHKTVHEAEMLALEKVREQNDRLRLAKRNARASRRKASLGAGTTSGEAMA